MNTRFQAPRQLPPLAFLLSDLGSPGADDLAQLLGVSVRSVYGWKNADQAPRSATLALFWESSFGRSLLDCDTVNAARVSRNHAAALERENAALKARIARLETIGHFGAANAPTYPALARPPWRVIGAP